MCCYAFKPQSEKDNGNAENSVHGESLNHLDIDETLHRVGLLSDTETEPDVAVEEEPGQGTFQRLAGPGNAPYTRYVEGATIYGNRWEDEFGGGRLRECGSDSSSYRRVRDVVW